MKKFYVLSLAILLISSCCISKRIAYKPKTEHQYEIFLTNESILYENIGLFIDSCTNNQCNSGVLNIRYMINEKGDIIDVEISSVLFLYVKNEDNLVDFLKNKSEISLSKDAQRYYQIIKKDRIFFNYNFVGTKIKWEN
jgi:hypothetical protein